MKRIKALKTALLGALGLYVLAAMAIAVSGLNDTLIQADLIVVPGNTVQPPGIPSEHLKARLDAALALFNQRRAPIVFVSGGVGGEGFDEAQVMADYLIGKGVPVGAIAVDSQGLDTAATARNAHSYMRGRALGSVIVVSQYFHIPRIKLAFKALGVCRIGSAHARHVELRDIYSLAREVVAYPVYYFKSARPQRQLDCATQK